MDCGVGVTLLETVVLLDVVQVMATNDNGAGHLGGDNHTTEDTAADRNVASEGALLVDVGTLDGLLGGLETEANVLVPSQGLLAGLLAEDALSAQKHGVLLLEGSLVLLHIS